MINFGIDLYNLVYPKWAKLRFKLSDQGKLLFIANPSLTPGKMPDGVKPGVVPKGTKIFDYSKESEFNMALTISECLQIIDFVKTQLPADTVDIIHKFRGDTKTIKFSWVTGNTGDVDFCNINISMISGPDGETKKIFVPIPFSGLREILAILNSYVNNIVTIKTLCLAELIGDSSKKKDSKSAVFRKDFKKAEDLPDYEEVESEP